MFTVTQAEAGAIRAAYEQGGDLSAAVELRWLFPASRTWPRLGPVARTIVGWKPVMAPPRR